MQKKYSDDGYSLVEMLVVIAILALVSVGIYAAFNVGQTEYGVRETTIRMQQQARLAMINLEKDLKMIGYGFVELGNLTVNVYSEGAPTSWNIIAANDNTVVSSLNNKTSTDILTLRCFNGPMDIDCDVTITTDHSASSADTPVSSIAGFNNGDLFIVYDPNDSAKPASMLQVTDTSHAGGGSLIHDSNQSVFNPPSGEINEIFPSTGYGPGCKVLNLGQGLFKRVRYYVDANLNLIRETQEYPTNIVRSHPVASGVEDLQFKYQFKNGNWLDAPVIGDTNYDVNNIRAVRVSLIVRARYADRNYNSAAAYQLTGNSGNGASFSGGGFRRLIMSTTISLRNMTIRG